MLRRTQWIFRGSFSAVSAPIFTIKGAFLSIFRDLQSDLFDFLKFCQFFGIFAGGALGGWLLSFSDYNTLLSVNVGLIVVWLCVCLSFPSTSPNAARTIPL